MSCQSYGGVSVVPGTQFQNRYASDSEVVRIALFRSLVSQDRPRILRDGNTSYKMRGDLGMLT
jgi:hypothetical protein